MATNPLIKRTPAHPPINKNPNPSRGGGGSRRGLLLSEGGGLTTKILGQPRLIGVLQQVMLPQLRQRAELIRCNYAAGNPSADEVAVQHLTALIKDRVFLNK